MKIYVEGGGDTHFLRTECRRGFSEFLRKAGLENNLLQIVACGGRAKAYDKFSTAIKNNEPALLLVDSEAPVAAVCRSPEDKPDEWKPWKHLKERKGDEWDIPAGAADRQCHLMTQCMEAWFLADREALAQFYGKDFNEKGLPAKENPIEEIEKKQVYQSFEKATKNCTKKGKYDKGDHSFAVLAIIDPDKVVGASPWAKRFVDEVRTAQGV